MEMSIISQTSSTSTNRSKKILLKPEDLIWSDEEEDINDKYIIKQNINSNKAYDSDEETSSTYMNEDKEKYSSRIDIDDSSLIDREGRLFDHNRSIFSGSVKVDKYIKSSKTTKLSNNIEKPQEYKQEFPNVPYNVKFILGSINSN